MSNAEIKETARMPMQLVDFWLVLGIKATTFVCPQTLVNEL